MNKLTIGKLKLKNNLFLAPMLDVTDLPYRLLCRRAGAAMTYTEMVYINSILHENEHTKKVMKTAEEDEPCGLQITGNSEEEFDKFVKSGKWKDFDLIDLNCGCPSIKITGNEAGSYLLENPKKIGRIIRILKKTRRPVTAKIRLGFKKNNVLQVAKEIERAGADAITVHARLATHGNEFEADWKWISRVRNVAQIPIIGNGDIFSGKDAERMLKETKCNGVMIARGALGDPMIFTRILNYLETGKVTEKDIKGNLKLFKEYLSLAEKYGVVDVGRVKYIGVNFLKWFNGAKGAREEFTGLKSFLEVKRFFERVI